MTLVQLRYLVAIADAGLNITLAAEQVHATQPGLSKQLKQLEAELGFQVFLRRGKSLERITPLGMQVLERARKILAEAGNIRALADNQRRSQGGELSIAATHTQARFVLPPAIAALRRRHPELSVRMEPGTDQEVIGQLDRGQTDLALVSSAGAPPAADVAIPLYRWRRVVVVPRGHALSARAQPLRLQDLVRYPLVSYESSRQPESSLQRAFTAIGMSPEIAMTARDGDLICTYVRAGLGVGVVAEMAADGVDAELLALSGADLFPVCTTWALLRRDRVHRQAVIDLIRALAPHLDAIDLRRALDGTGTPDWSQAPDWPIALDSVA